MSSNKKIIKALKKQEKSGVPVVLPTPPNNLFAPMISGGSNEQLQNLTIVNQNTGKSQVIPVIDSNLLAQLQAANIVVQNNLEENEENTELLTLMEEEDDDSGRMNNFVLDQEDAQFQSQIDAGLLLVQGSQSGGGSPLSSNEDGVGNNSQQQPKEVSALSNELLAGEYPHSNQCCETCRVTLSVMLRMLTDLKEKINAAPALSNNNHLPSIPENTNCKLLPKFPIKKTKKFPEFDKKLQDSEEFKAAFKTEIAKIGGKNVQKGTKAILDFLFTNDFAAKSSWTGIHGGVKIKDTVLVQILTEFLVAKYGETKDKVQDRIKEWFQRGSDRLKAELKIKEPEPPKESTKI